MPIINLPLESLKAHFRKLMSASNMFAIPLRYSGLGELPQFCGAMRQHLEIRRPVSD